MILKELMDLSGWIGWGIAVILGIFNIIQYTKERPIIKIQRKIYRTHKLGEELSPKEYAKRVSQGDFNNADKFEVKEIVLDVTNKGHRNANLKGVLPLYLQKGKDPFSPKVINFYPITIPAEDREEVHLFFEFPIEIIKDIEKVYPNEILVEFDFVHKKIKEKFVIGK